MNRTAFVTPRSTHAAGHNTNSLSVSPSAPTPRLAYPAAHARYGHSFSQVAVSPPPTPCEAAEGRMPLKAEGGPEAQPDVPAASGSGQTLPAPVRGRMERSFGHDFADVRIHSGGEASQVGALAYTRGSDIHFRPGLYDVDSLGGQELLGHELTHVVQQRAGRVSAPQNKSLGTASINADTGLEAEADALGARAARGQTAQVSGASGGGLQRKTDVVQCKPGFFSKLFGGSQDKPEEKPSEMTDADVDTYRMQKGETSGRVDRVGYNKPIGESGQNNGFFKPEWQPGNPIPAVMGNTVLDPANLEEHQPEAVENGLRLGSRAVASSRLDKALGTDVIAEEVFASHQGEGGSVSAAVLGRSIIEGNDYGSMHVNHDFARPETQKSLSDLQVNHFISGQLDAHGGNVFIDPATGKAKGIDNDGAFLPGEVPKVGPVMNMPQQIDLETGKKILAMKAKNLGGILNGANPEEKQLTPDEIAAAQGRMRGLKAHVKDLKRDHQLIGQTKYGEDGEAVRDADGNKVKSGWGQETYDASVAAGKASRLEGGYVGRSVRDRSPDRLQDNEYREEDSRRREENFALPFAAVSNMNQAERQFDKYDAYGNDPDKRFIQDLPMNDFVRGRATDDPLFAPNDRPMLPALNLGAHRAPGVPGAPVSSKEERSGFDGGFDQVYSSHLKAKGPAPLPPRDPAIEQLMSSRMSDSVYAPNSSLAGPEEAVGRPRARSGAYGVPIPATFLADAPALGGPAGQPSAAKGGIADRLGFFEELARGVH